MSADAYGEDVTWALKAITGILHSTSSTGTAQPLDLKTEAVPSTFGLTGAVHRLDLKMEESPFFCDELAEDFEEGDQSGPPADISAVRASEDQGRGKRRNL